MTRPSATEEHVKIHIDAMCEFMRMIDNSNIPKRDAEKISEWFEALTNVDTPAQLDQLYGLMEITRFTPRELYNSAIAKLEAKIPCTPDEVDAMQAYFKKLFPTESEVLNAEDAQKITDHIVRERIEPIEHSSSLHVGCDYYMVDGQKYEFAFAFGHDGAIISKISPYVWKDPNAIVTPTP